jgi:hypothetical protein
LQKEKFMALLLFRSSHFARAHLLEALLAGKNRREKQKI